MSSINQAQYLREIEYYSKKPQDSWFQLMVAICHTKLGDLQTAKQRYQQALEGGRFQDGQGFKWFLFTGEVEKLGEIYILANQPKSFKNILNQQIEGYKSDPRSNAPVPQYAFALQCLIERNDEQAASYVDKLLKKPKLKHMFAVGRTIDAIVSKDQLALDNGLSDLVLAHRELTERGSLRETPLGHLSLAAMALSKMAVDRFMMVNLASEYLSIEYLNYLMANSS